MMRYYYTPLEQIKIRTVTTAKVNNDAEQLHLSYIAGRKLNGANILENRQFLF